MEPQLVTLSFAGVVPTSSLDYIGAFSYRTDQVPILSTDNSSTYRVAGEIRLLGTDYVTTSATIEVEDDVTEGIAVQTTTDRLSFSGTFVSERFVPDPDDPFDEPLPSETLQINISLRADQALFDNTRLPGDLGTVPLEQIFGLFTAVAFDTEAEPTVLTTLTTSGDEIDIVNDLSLVDVQRIALLYEAGLDRDGEIDLAGLNFWIDQRELGLSEEDLALAFLESAEFRNTVGDPDLLTDREIVEGLYENVLDRSGETAGVDFWTNALASPNFDRVDLLIEFADSTENVSGSPTINQLEETSPGFWEFVA